MSNKWLAFDIETAQPAPEDGTDYALGVTCAATMRTGDDKPLLWGNTPRISGRYADKLTPRQVCELANYLIRHANDGYRVAGINSLGFDLRVLAVESQDLITFDNLRDLALSHYDPAFQMLAERGFMIGMKALGVGLRLQEQKMAEMDGQKAVEMWAGSREDQDRVLEYVAQDARTTLAIMEAIEERGLIVWQTRRGAISSHRLMRGLLPVSDCLALSLPDTDWMRRRGSEPWPRERFSGWTKESE
ncbi:MAG: hypothetical protein GY832_26085 [Chloroflexi bacterium]|nr:hypothetical protein [Chloroflexota bacterium]